MSTTAGRIEIPDPDINMSRTPSEALNKVLKEYGITGIALASRSGIDKSSISRFRNGKSEMYSDNLQRLIKSLPVRARIHFFLLAFFSDEE